MNLMFLEKPQAFNGGMRVTEKMKNNVQKKYKVGVEAALEVMGENGSL